MLAALIALPVLWLVIIAYLIYTDKLKKEERMFCFTPSSGL